jgi:hypothetical protein
MEVHGQGIGVDLTVNLRGQTFLSANLWPGAGRTRTRREWN